MKVPMYHHECKKIALFTEGKFQIGDAIKASRIFFLDGSQPKAGEPITLKCGSCGKTIGFDKKFITHNKPE